MGILRGYGLAAGEDGAATMMFLTADELHELTGRVRWSAQIRWLRDNHWAFTVRADGRPVVTKQEVERQLVTGGAKPRQGTDEPDFAAARRAG